VLDCRCGAPSHKRGKPARLVEDGVDVFSELRGSVIGLVILLTIPILNLVFIDVASVADFQKEWPLEVGQRLQEEVQFGFS